MSRKIEVVNPEEAVSKIFKELGQLSKLSDTTRMNIAQSILRADETVENVVLFLCPDFRSVIIDILEGANQQATQVVIEAERRSSLLELITRLERPLRDAYEKLTMPERASVDEILLGHHRGIVHIKKNSFDHDFEEQLSEDRHAGQTCEDVLQKVLANDGLLAKKSARLSEIAGDPSGRGIVLIGFFNGKLAIRQKSSEIVNGIWTNRNTIKLLHHPEAIESNPDKWANFTEAYGEAKRLGFSLISSSKPYQGVVPAFEAVTGGCYIDCPRINGQSRGTIIGTKRDSDLCVIGYQDDSVWRETYYGFYCMESRKPNYGLILWVLEE